MKIVSIISALTFWGVAFAANVTSTINGTSSTNFTVAIVRAPPANLPYPPGVNTNFYGRKYDINATVELAIGHIHEAAQKGANLIAFPELWFPGYYFGPSEGPSEQLDQYLTQGLAVNSTNWNKLINAAATNNIWLEFGFARPEADLIYMGQAIIDSSGQVVQIRNKLRPSGGERQIFSDGTIDMLQVHSTPFGRLGALECWEHMWPSMTFAMHAQVENLHIAAFPWAPDLGIDIGVTSADVSLAAARLYAVQGGTWVFMPSVGTAAIIAPNGTVVVQAEASDCPLAKPMLYHSVDTSDFNKTKSYDINGQFSWAALQQIDAAYPEYIPHQNGTFIAHRENPVSELRKNGPLPDPY